MNQEGTALDTILAMQETGAHAEATTHYVAVDERPPGLVMLEPLMYAGAALLIGAVGARALRSTRVQGAISRSMDLVATRGLELTIGLGLPSYALLADTDPAIVRWGAALGGVAVAAGMHYAKKIKGD